MRWDDSRLARSAGVSNRPAAKADSANMDNAKSIAARRILLGVFINVSTTHSAGSSIRFIAPVFNLDIGSAARSAGHAGSRRRPGKNLVRFSIELVIVHETMSGDAELLRRYAEER